jgi:hypothetical protein
MSPRRGDRVTVPRSGALPDRQHRLRGDLATHRHNGRDMEQWEYEVTSGGRVRYVIDDDKRTVWLLYASPAIPKTPIAERRSRQSPVSQSSINSGTRRRSI